MGIKRSILSNAAAGGLSKISSVLLRLLQIPMLLSVLGSEEYGRWLILSSFPTWLALANLGFGSVAANEMSMAAGANDLIKARRVFSTTLAFVVGIGVAGTVLFTIVAFYFRWDVLLQVAPLRQHELARAMVWLVMALFLSFLGEVFGGRFRAVKRTHESILINSLRPWLDLLALFITLHYTTRFDYLSASILGSTLIYLLILQGFSWRAAPHLEFSIAQIQPNLVRQLFRKGIAFQAIPLGNAILYEGNLLIVQAILGPAAVALFGTVRVLTRSVCQMVDLINIVTWPELSLLIGAGDLVKAARLHRLAVGAAIILSVLGIVFLALFGNVLYSWWVGSFLNLPRHLLMLFLLPIPFYSVWYTSCVVHMSCNKHEGLAVHYILACSSSAIACCLLSITKGIEGAALSTLFADLLLIPYVLKRSLELTGDNWRSFLMGFAHEISHINQWVRFKRMRTGLPPHL